MLKKHRHNKQVKDGYIIAIGTGDGGEEITIEEYTALFIIIHLEKPTAKEGFDFRLREDLTWEEYELPQIEPSDEISDEEALNIILGGSV